MTSSNKQLVLVTIHMFLSLITLILASQFCWDARTLELVHIKFTFQLQRPLSKIIRNPTLNIDRSAAWMHWLVLVLVHMTIYNTLSSRKYWYFFFISPQKLMLWVLAKIAVVSKAYIVGTHWYYLSVQTADSCLIYELGQVKQGLNPFTHEFLTLTLLSLTLDTSIVANRGFSQIHNRMANSVDPDKMTHYEPSHLDLHCLPRWSIRMKG